MEEMRALLASIERHESVLKAAQVLPGGVWNGADLGSSPLSPWGNSVSSWLSSPLLCTPASGLSSDSAISSSTETRPKEKKKKRKPPRAISVSIIECRSTVPVERIESPGGILQQNTSSFALDAVPTPPSSAPNTNNPSAYKIGPALGQGQFGTVYKAEGPQGQVAVKKVSFLPEHMQSSIPQELQIAKSKQRHPNIIHIHDAFYVEELQEMWIVQELMNCKSLHGALDRLTKAKRPRSVAEHVVAGITMQLLGALHHLHTQATVYLHRDIKPDNILMNSKGEVKLGDFGSARCAGDLGIAHTYEAGSEAYMSPERIKGEAYGPPSDIFSAVFVVAELLKGNKTQEGDFLQIINNRERMGELFALEGASPEVLDFVKDGLNPQQARRPSAEQLLQSDFIQKHCTTLPAAQDLVKEWVRSLKELSRSS